MTWLVRLAVFLFALQLLFAVAPSSIQAQQCPSTVNVDLYPNVSLTGTQQQNLRRVVIREYETVCKSQGGSSSLESFVIVPDTARTYRLPDGRTVTITTEPIKYYGQAASGEPFLVIKQNAALGLIQGQNTQVLRTEIGRSFVAGAPTTTGGDEDVEEGAPIDGAGGAAAAAAGAGCVERGRLIPSRPENCTVGDIVALITEVVLPFFLSIAGGIAIIMILWGAFQYFTAYGDPQKIDAGKKTLTWAIIGLVVIVAARAIITYSCEFFAADKNICNVETRQ